MNGKQAGIILTLLALIVCTGVLATRVNNQIKESMGEVPMAFGESDKGETVETSSDYFYESRNLREQKDSKTIANLKAIVEDKNTSEDQKKEAEKELTEKTMARDYETRIELSIKSKGYEDVICFIDGDNAKVVVKTNEDLTQEKMVEIQDIVMNVSKIYDVDIEKNN
ncbi:SpoIIIAH-like family protein [Clostridium sp.]|uniref:SpoIIIAH-like family protein n=1 Tax=Clostridium sp. TaxID=1506 RepID=UPI002612C379|nr:SpoIIIAH-like family protein [Clostridium sp.]